MLRLVTAATDPILTLEETKLHLRVDHTDDDTLIQALIDAVTARLDGRDGILGRCLREQTWELVIARFPTANQPIQLPLPPTIEVASVKYLSDDGLGTIITMDAEDYRVIDGGLSGALIVPEDAWPSTDDEPDAVRIEFQAGYESAESPPENAVPAAIKQAALLIIGDLYDNRGSSVIGTNVMPMPFAADVLLAPYRLIPVA